MRHMKTKNQPPQAQSAEKDDTVLVSVRVPRTVKEALVAYSRAQDMTLSQLARRVLRSKADSLPQRASA